MAQASARDARDILNLPAKAGQSSASGPGVSSTSSRPPTAPTNNQGPPTLKKPTQGRYKRADGIHKELQALLGDNAPSLAVAQSEAKAMLAGPENSRGFRPKFKRKERKPRGWKWQSFDNPARSDGLQLHHWVPAADESRSIEDGKPDYPFANLNTTSGVYSYSSEEYQQHLRDDDWSKEETDYLIDLCQAYDLRFVVIADRWDWPQSSHKTNRTMEDLKARYYAICRRLIRSRISVEDMEARQQLLATYAFDKSREVERKKLLQRLFTRTPAQLAEEEALYVEARRLEQNEAKFAADREDLLKLLGGWERVPAVSGSLIAEAGAGVGQGTSSVPGAPGSLAAGGGDEGGASSAASDGKRGGMKRRRINEDDGSSTTAPSTPVTLTSKQKAELKQAHYDETHCIHRFDPEATPLARPPYPFLVGTPSTLPPVAPSPNNPSSSHGVYLRSTRVLAPRQAQLNRTMQSLSELGHDAPEGTAPSTTSLAIGPRLIFPTRSNCEKWEGLLGAVTSGLEMKKQTDRVESELRIAKSRLAALQQQSVGDSSQALAASGGEAIKTGTGSANKTLSGGSRRNATPRAGGSETADAGSRARASRSRTPASALTSTVPSSMAAVAAGQINRDGATVSAGGSKQGEEAGSAQLKNDEAAADDDADDEEWKDAKEGEVGTDQMDVDDDEDGDDDDEDVDDGDEGDDDDDEGQQEEADEDEEEEEADAAAVDEDEDAEEEEDEDSD